MRQGRSSGANIASVLPGASRNWPQALFTPSPNASLSPSAPRDRSGYSYGDRNRHTVWLLAIWQTGGGIQGGVWRDALPDARPVIHPPVTTPGMLSTHFFRK